MKSFFPYFLLASLSLISLSLRAEENYEELRYEDLVQKLNQSPRTSAKAYDNGLDEIRLHAGVGFVSGVSSIKMNQVDNMRSHNGLEVRLGVDLFDPQWISYFVFTNYGQSKSGNETRSLRSFAFRVTRVIPQQSQSELRVGLGIGNRYLRLSDASEDLYFDETTPFVGAQVGIAGALSRDLALVLEARAETAMSTQTIDKNSMSFAIGVEGHF